VAASEKKQLNTRSWKKKSVGEIVLIVYKNLKRKYVKNCPFGGILIWQLSHNLQNETGKMFFLGGSRDNEMAATHFGPRWFSTGNKRGPKA
jgi:hypothetical protein